MATRRMTEPRMARSANGGELANVVTHGLGIVLSVLGAVGLMSVVLRHGDAWRVAGCAVYGVHLIAVYAMSTLSHSFSSPSWRSLFRALDQGCIYLLIAATYTPFSLTYLRTPFGWLLLSAIWGIALYGFGSKVIFAHRVESVSIWPCIVLGWMPTLAVPSLFSRMPLGGLCWMLAGGICYSLGTVFLVHDDKGRHYHAVWHLLVIAGSACHFLAILWFVAI